MNWKIINVLLMLVIILICSFTAYGIGQAYDTYRPAHLEYLYSGYYIAVRRDGLSGGRVFENFTLNQIECMISHAVDENTISFKIKISMHLQTATF